LLLDKLNNRVVNSHRELHRQFRWNHVGYDKNAPKHDLVATSVWVLEAFSHHMVARRKCKNKQDQEVHIHFWRLDRHSFLAEQDNSHQLALFRLKTILENEANDSISGRLGKLRAISLWIFRWRKLQNFGAAEQ
jgi:hypothetical protein